MEDETLIEREIFDILFRSQAVTRCIPPDSPAQGKKLTLRANCNEAESGQIFWPGVLHQTVTWAGCILESRSRHQD